MTDSVHGDTLILLADGKRRPIRELYKQYLQDGKDVPLWGFDRAWTAKVTAQTAVPIKTESDLEAIRVIAKDRIFEGGRRIAITCSGAQPLLTWQTSTLLHVSAQQLNKGMHLVSKHQEPASEWSNYALLEVEEVKELSIRFEGYSMTDTKWANFVLGSGVVAKSYKGG